MKAFPTYLRIDLDHAYSGPTNICRNLLEEGVPPDTKIEFYRGKTLCFVTPTTVGAWAALSAVESKNGRHMRFETA